MPFCENSNNALATNSIHMFTSFQACKANKCSINQYHLRITNCMQVPTLFSNIQILLASRKKKIHADFQLSILFTSRHIADWCVSKLLVYLIMVEFEESLVLFC